MANPHLSVDDVQRLVEMVGLSGTVEIRMPTPFSPVYIDSSAVNEPLPQSTPTLTLTHPTGFSVTYYLSEEPPQNAHLLYKQGDITKLGIVDHAYYALMPIALNGAPLAAWGAVYEVLVKGGGLLPSSRVVLSEWTMQCEIHGVDRRLPHVGE